MCRPNETHQDHHIHLTYLYIINCVRIHRHTTGEAGDLLLYSCSSFRVPFIAYTLTHAHTHTHISVCVCVYEIFFRILFLFLSFHFSGRSIEFALPATLARALSDSFSQCPFRNRYNCAADTPRYSPIENSKTLYKCCACRSRETNIFDIIFLPRIPTGRLDLRYTRHCSIFPSAYHTNGCILSTGNCPTTMRAAKKSKSYCNR